MDNGDEKFKVSDGRDSSIIEESPEEQRFIEERKLIMAMQGFVPASNPLAEKLTPELIGKMIDNAESESKRDFETEKLNKICVYVLIGVVLVIFFVLILAFRNHMQDIEKLLTHLLTFGFGLAGGYGIGKANKE